jgi:signal transduction histidine kinase
MGWQAKMTTSYVAVTAGAVLLAEIVMLVMASLHATTTLTAQELADRAQATATVLAGELAAYAGKAGQIPAGSLGKGMPTPGVAHLDSGGVIVIPETTGALCDPEPASFAVVISPSGTVLATSYPACFPAGSRPAEAAIDAGAPAKQMETSPQGSGVTSFPHGRVVWATAPVVLGSAAAGKPPATPGAADGEGVKQGNLYGTLYAEAPPVAAGLGDFTAPARLISAGAAVLALSVPVGVTFGLLSTRRLNRRLKRLAACTAAVADGEFGLRVPVAGADELSVVEQSFNRMAGRLQASLDAERQLSAANARHHERSRIARELHDSISQELFSLSVMSGGLRRALPPDSPLLPAVQTMEQTAGDSMREMQALLLELRPIALGEAGLVTALDRICRAYRERLGVSVQADLAPLVLPAADEHAVLRVAQEALANAVKHACAGLIRLRLVGDENRVTMEVSDDGAGFDVSIVSDAGLGLRAMRDRVAELGGTLDIASEPGAGTVVRAAFPVRGPT